ncbi:MAG: M23 family metallopeptidase [Rikenellaceae bacterium]
MSKRRKNRNRITVLRRRKRLKRNALRLLLRAFVWSGVAILYYAIFSIFFDTPLEYQLKVSSENMRAEYQILEARYDSLAKVMASVSERDRSIFRVMFESDPYDFESDHDNQRLELHEELLGLSSNDLRERFNERVADFTNTVTELESSSENLVRKMNTQGLDIDNIPAIQPIINKQLTLLTASYGMRIHPFYKTLQSHQGVDFTIPEGTRVFATADGVVKSVSLKNSTQGKQIIIDHGNGYETSYSHLNFVVARRGQRVKRGDIIGESGNTGLSLTPHLHYEVRLNSTRVDPIHYFFGELSPSDYQRMIRIAQSGMQSFD